MNQGTTARRDTARMDPRSGACREGHLSLFVRVDVNDDRDGTAVADEDDRLSPGDEGDEGLGGRVQETGRRSGADGSVVTGTQAGLAGVPSPPRPAPPSPGDTATG
jgi:hypothetical protein